MPKRFASTATCILNRPSASTGMPNMTHRNVMASPGWHRVMTPTAASRMPKARSYWNASRNRSREKYPPSLTAPQTTMPMPSARPIHGTQRSAMTNSTTPSTQNSADITIYPVFTAHSGPVALVLRIDSHLLPRRGASLFMVQYTLLRRFSIRAEKEDARKPGICAYPSDFWACGRFCPSRVTAPAGCCGTRSAPAHRGTAGSSAAGRQGIPPSCRR